MRRRWIPQRSPSKEFCKCGHQFWGHRPKIHSCYACDCQGFTPGVNPVHRNQVARAVKQEYNGRIYDSKEEAKYAAQLDFRLKANDIEAWEYHPYIRIEWNGIHLCDYTLDFLVYLKDGWTEYVEVKGEIANTPVWRMKWKMAKAYFRFAEKVKLTLVPV